MKKIAIIGCGGFGREVKMLIDQINIKKQTYEIIGFYDDNTEQPELINGVPFLGKISDINKIEFECALALGLGTPEVKKNVVNKITNHNVYFPTLIHPNVQIGADNVKIGEGNIICAGVIITIDVTLKDFITLNLCCTVGHDTIINSYSSFMPSTNISGEVLISDCTYVGTGVKIINQVEIGENTIVGAGAVVAKSLPANCTAVGIPAKPIKFNK